MEAIESSVNGLESEITRHKKAATAHTSEQIDHGGFSLRTYIDGLYNRVRNLILNADGTNVKEVVDARVNADGEIAPLLKERLDKEYNKLLRKITRNVNVDDYGPYRGDRQHRSIQKSDRKRKSAAQSISRRIRDKRRQTAVMDVFDRPGHGRHHAEAARGHAGQ